MSDLTGAGHDTERAAARRRRLTRTIAAVALVGLAVWFIAENSQPVTVHFWVVSAHPRLIWVILGCLVVGGVIGYLLSRQRNRRRR